MLLLMRALARLPLRTLHRLGTLLGWLGYLVSPGYRRRLRRHARQAGLSRAQRDAAVSEAGRMVAELPWLWLRPPGRRLDDVVRMDDAALVERAVQADRGIVFLTPHLGCFEVTAQAVAERWGGRKPLTVLYRPARQDWLREVQRTARDRPGLATAAADLAGVRQMIRALRRGEAVGLLPDQVPPDGMGVWAPFFGQPAYTMTLASRLVQQTGATMLLIWAERLSGGQGYRLRISEPAAPLPARAGDDAAWQVACATAINREMERLILQCPTQYLWGYHRYKQPRPTGAGDAPEAPR